MPGAAPAEALDLGQAKFYAITKTGRAQLKAETGNWARISGVIDRVLRPEGGLPAAALAKAES